MCGWRRKDLWVTKRQGSFEGFFAAGGDCAAGQVHGRGMLLRQAVPVSYMKREDWMDITARDVAEAAEMGCADAGESPGSVRR